MNTLVKMTSRRVPAGNSGWVARPVALVVGIFVLLAGASSYGHQHTAPWLNESKLDQGLYLEVRHPSVIRKPGGFDVSVVMNNLTGGGDVLVREVRYLAPDPLGAVTHPREHLLTSKRAAYRRYKETLEQLEHLGQGQDRTGLETIADQNRSLLMEITADTFADRQSIPAGAIPKAVGSSFNMSVEIDLVQNGTPRTLTEQIEIPVETPLPKGTDGSWFAGDQHLHTAYSIDAFLLSFTFDNVTDYAQTAQLMGLDWIIITDHTNIHFLIWYTPVLFAAGERQAQAFRDSNGYLVLQGEEMGLGRFGFFNEAAHLLAYPYTSDSTGFLENPCSGLIFNHVNCEDEQVVIDRVNDNGGIGFIAHPFDSVPLFFAKWDFDSPAVGWAGLEIFNSDVGVFSREDQQTVDKWHELLDQIAPPQNGQLLERLDFPTRFPVGLGNSDAHSVNLIGNTFTYAKLSPPGPSITRQDVMDAFVNGRVVATNGPLVFGTINGAGAGEVAILSAIQNQLQVTLQTTPELGPVGDYEITVFVNGLERMVIPPSGSPDFQTTILLDDLLAPPDKFVTIRARSADDARQAIANPIWLEFQDVATGIVSPLREY
ncbi:MAG: hypothetical protein ACE5JX_04695 [Acidobacteriota bacterium]